MHDPVFVYMCSCVNVCTPSKLASLGCSVFSQGLGALFLAFSAHRAIMASSSSAPAARVGTETPSGSLALVPQGPVVNVLPSASSGSKRKHDAVNKIARYGCLDVKYYPLLEALPTVALPMKPPSGQHSYVVKHFLLSEILVNLKAQKFTVVYLRRSRTFQWKLHGGMLSAWERAACVADDWHTSPPRQPPVAGAASDSDPDTAPAPGPSDPGHPDQ